MANFRKLTAALAVTLALVSAPALAQSRTNHAGHAARAQAFESVIVQDGVSADRARALRACIDLAAPFKNYAWGNTEIEIYRSCMVQHGQPE